MKVKKSFTGVEVESDLPEKVYGDVKKEFTKDEKEVLGVAGNVKGSTTEEIAALTGKDEVFVDNTMKKAERYGGATKKNGKWYTEPKFVILLIGATAFILLALSLGGGVLGAKAQMGDVSAGKTAVPVQQSPFSSTLGLGDLTAGRGVQFTPLMQSPFSSPATIGEIGEKGLGMQWSPFSPVRQAEIGTTYAAEGGVAAPEIKQTGANILGTTKDFGNVYQQGNMVFVGNGIQQQQRISEQGGTIGLFNIKEIKQTADYKNLTAEEKAILEAYL